MNPGGSVKDRIAKKMVEEAEKEGKMVKEPSPTVIIEPTAGNTGTDLIIVNFILNAIVRYWVVFGRSSQRISCYHNSS